ncbi:MAG: hypothetical protein V4727_06045 [Verrucomicrobiota bacterium]
MKTPFFAISLFILSLQGSLHAAEPTSELSEELAKRLVSEVLEIAPSGINVATVIEGGMRSKDGFEERDVRRVTAIHPVLEEGRMVRRVFSYDFSWSSKYGWFYKENRQTRGGEEVWIWSETEGELVVK